MQNLNPNSFNFVLGKNNKIWYFLEIWKLLLKADFFSSLEYEVFEVDISHACEIHYSLYVDI
jgi:hypothetical protein